MVLQSYQDDTVADYVYVTMQDPLVLTNSWVESSGVLRLQRKRSRELPWTLILFTARVTGAGVETTEDNHGNFVLSVEVNSASTSPSDA